jgi:hypothetical protein
MLTKLILLSTYKVSVSTARHGSAPASTRVMSTSPHKFSSIVGVTLYETGHVLWEPQGWSHGWPPRSWMVEDMDGHAPLDRGAVSRPDKACWSERTGTSRRRRIRNDCPDSQHARQRVWVFDATTPYRLSALAAIDPPQNSTPTGEVLEPRKPNNTVLLTH